MLGKVAQQEAKLAVTIVLVSYLPTGYRTFVRSRYTAARFGSAEQGREPTVTV